MNRIKIWFWRHVLETAEGAPRYVLTKQDRQRNKVALLVGIVVAIVMIAGLLWVAVSKLVG